MSREAGSRVELRARDGTPLVGHLFAASSPSAGLLVAPATGVKASFYRHFAAGAARQGLTTLVFDFRGIGESLVGHVRDSRARLQDWGQLDLSGALEALAERAPGLPLHLVGHSAGGQLVGLMDNALRLERIVLVAGSSGWLGGMGWRMRALGWLLLHVYGPLSIRVVGYAAVRPLGWGEDLPAGVALQWRDWCSTPGYVESSFGTTVERHHYDELRAPLLDLTATDDAIATETNVRDLLRLFPNAEVTSQRLDPRAFGARSLGHVGFFRPENRELWEHAWSFLRAGSRGT